MRQVALHVTSDTPSRTKNTRKWTCALRNFFPTIQFIVCSDQIKQDPLRKQALQEVRAANAQLTDVKSRKKIQAVQPHAVKQIPAERKLVLPNITFVSSEFGLLNYVGYWKICMEM